MIRDIIQKNTLKRVILEQQNLFLKPYILREKLSALQKKSETGSIIILSGVRRCGKSVLLSTFQNQQKEKSYYINFDDERLYHFSVEDFEVLYEVFLELFGKESCFYFDEIQNVNGWEQFIRRLHDYGNKIFITGSNAKLLSRELGTHLTGRYVQIDIFPASFFEFLQWKNFSYDEQKTFTREGKIEILKLYREYFEKGGFFPYLQDNDKDFFKILYENILYKDIIARYSLLYTKGIQEIFHFLLSNIAKPFSYTTLKSISNIQNITTIKDYISYLEDSYLLFSVSLYDPSLKRQLINPKKIYAIDTGLANALAFRFSEDAGRILENLVFLQLRRQEKTIFYHKQKKECDFIVQEKLQIIEAYQVSISLQDPETRKREIDGLLDAMNAYGLSTGYIITEEEEEEILLDNKKILVLPFWKWALFQQ